MTMMVHGTQAHEAAEVRVGLCLTDRESAAVDYARCQRGDQPILRWIELDTADLVLAEVDAHDPTDDDAYGDDGTHTVDADVVAYDDITPSGIAHRTWRLMTDRAVRACTEYEPEDVD